jgi:microcystin-dependent protein
MAEPFIAEIRMAGFNFAPVGWATCDGQLLSIAQNTALFSLLGTTFGGNGTTNFGLPDLRGSAPLHFGQGPGLTDRSLGEKSGAATVTLAANELPAHTHTFQGVAASATSNNPVGNLPASIRTSTPYSPAGGTTSAMSASAIGGGGSNQPHNNMQPYQTILFIIALQGIYPSRP